jgi:hypothetical protein
MTNHSELDMVVWANWTHDDTCYDKRYYLMDIMKEFDKGIIEMKEAYLDR